jgi:hypothetical protein
MMKVELPCLLKIIELVDKLTPPDLEEVMQFLHDKAFKQPLEKKKPFGDDDLDNDYD